MDVTNLANNAFTKAWEVVLGPAFSSVTGLGPKEAIEITDKTILKYLIDNRQSIKVTIDSSDGMTLRVYILTFENKNQIFYFLREDMIKYKMRTTMYQLDNKARSTTQTGGNHVG